MRNVMFAATGIMGWFIMAGCQYQPAPLAPDPYTQSTFLGNDWPIGDGKPGDGNNPDTFAGTIAEEE